MQEAYRLFKALILAKRQTKYFILFTAIYMGLLIWTTVQSYARLVYSRSDRIEKPIIIEPNGSSQNS